MRSNSNNYESKTLATPSHNWVPREMITEPKPVECCLASQTQNETSEAQKSAPKETDEQQKLIRFNFWRRQTGTLTRGVLSVSCFADTTMADRLAWLERVTVRILSPARAGLLARSTWRESDGRPAAA